MFICFPGYPETPTCRSSLLMLDYAWIRAEDKPIQGGLRAQLRSSHSLLLLLAVGCGLLH